MNYLGGKHRQGKIIAWHILQVLGVDGTYIEPFVGACGVAHRIAADATSGTKLIFSDIHEPLITFWKAVMNGWQPPDVVSEDLYTRIKAKRDPKDPLTAYVGFGMSFGGKYFGGYARNVAGTNYAANLQRSTLLKTNSLLKSKSLLKADVEFRCCDFRNYATVTDAVIYLDPPYANRTKIGTYVGKFNHDEFWEFAEKISRNNIVFVTEFSAPCGWNVLHNFGDTVVRHYSSRGADGTTECLFMR